MGVLTIFHERHTACEIHEPFRALGTRVGKGVHANKGAAAAESSVRDVAAIQIKQYTRTNFQSTRREEGGGTHLGDMVTPDDRNGGERPIEKEKGGTELLP